MQRLQAPAPDAPVDPRADDAGSSLAAQRTDASREGAWWARARCEAERAGLTIAPIAPLAPSLHPSVTRDVTSVWEGARGVLLVRERAETIELEWLRRAPLRGLARASTAHAAGTSTRASWRVLAVELRGAFVLRCEETAGVACRVLWVEEGATTAPSIELPSAPAVTLHEPGVGVVLGCVEHDHTRALRSIAVGGGAWLAPQREPTREQQRRWGIFVSRVGAGFSAGFVRPTEGVRRLQVGDAAGAVVRFEPEGRPLGLSTTRIALRVDGELTLDGLGSRDAQGAIELAVVDAFDGAIATLTGLELRVRDLASDGWVVTGPSLRGTARTAGLMTPVRCRVIQASDAEPSAPEEP